MANNISEQELQRQSGCNDNKWRRLFAETRNYMLAFPPSQNQNTSIQWDAYAERWLSSEDTNLTNRTIGEVIFEASTVGSLHWPQDQRKITNAVAGVFRHHHRMEIGDEFTMFTDSNGKAIDQGMKKAPIASMIADSTTQQAKETQSPRKPMAKRSRDNEDLISKSKKMRPIASTGGADQTSNNIPDGEIRKRQSISVSSSVPEDPSLNLPLRKVSNPTTQKNESPAHPQHHEATSSSKSAGQQEVRSNGHPPQSIGNPVFVQSSTTDPATREKSETIIDQQPFTAVSTSAWEELVSIQENSIKERFQALSTASPPSTEKINRSTSNVANTSRPQQVLPVSASPLPRAQATAANSRRLRTKVIFRTCDQSLGYFKDSDMRFESIDAFFEAISRQTNASERINHLTFDFGENSFKNVCVDKGNPDDHLDFYDILELAKRYKLEQSSDHLSIGLSF